MKLGIVGLPNVGKSTLFNSLTKAGAESANYPFCTIDPNVGVVSVPDERLNKLSDLYDSDKIVPAVIEFVDIAGLVKGASKGEGLGNQVLANFREVDAIVHVVRCFDNSNIIHVEGSINPLRDIETINLELIFSDIEILDRRLQKVGRAANNDKTLAKERDLILKLKALLEEGKLAKQYETDDDEEKLWIKEYNLLTGKPVIFAANVEEDDLADDGASNENVAKVREFAKSEGFEVFVVCAQIEQEISELDDEEKAMFLEGTHFNPVDLVCAIKNYKGEKFDLPKYVDKSTGFISSKSKGGRSLKALELPGLWNGAMSDWNTIFVEVPLTTFNPVKTVNDLLRDQHQK